MKAYGNSFSIIRNNYLYEIPFFQRRYVWEEENWKELLDSLSDADDCPFLGSIILKENKDSEDNIFWTVIDGQQRLTTLSILMRACFDELTAIKNTERFRSEYDDEDPWSEEVRTPFNETTHIKDSNKNRHTKIRHSRIDHIDFEKVMNGDIKDSYENTDSEKTSKIISCYCFFRKALKEKGLDTVWIIWEYLTKRIGDRDENGKYLVIIELGNKENEQAIFDTVNTAGVRLTCSDTIKNTLFQRYIDVLRDSGVSSNNSQDKATKLYDDQWDSIFSSSQDSIAYWNKSRQVGRLYRDNIEILLHCIAVIKGFFDPAEKKMSDLPQCYKDYISALSYSDIEAFIKEINTYAKLYQDNFEEVESEALYYYDSEQYLSRIMHIVDVLEISTFLPYILYLLFQKEQGNQSDVKEHLLALERYLILHAICGESTKNYNKECIQLIKGTSIDVLLASCENINSERFKYGLYHMNSNKLATLLLFWIELYKRSVSNADLKKISYAFTLEHIMPQKWEQYWSVQVLPVYSENGEIEENEDLARRIRSDAVYQIGNMTLLTAKLNTSLRNYDFARKVNGEGRKRGMKALADCMITREILELPAWKETDIISRTAKLSEYICKIWGLSFV